MRGMRKDEGYSEDPLLKGNLVITQLTQQIYQNAQTFGKMDLKSSKMDLLVLFTSIKRNFFQKVAFYTNQTDFWAGFFQNATFGLKKLKQTNTITPQHMQGL